MPVLHAADSNQLTEIGHRCQGGSGSRNGDRSECGRRTESQTEMKREREEAVLRHSPALIGRDLSSYVQCDDGDLPNQTYNKLNSFVSRQHWHPEFKQYDEARHRYVPKGYREPWQRKYGLGRRYSKNAPKVTVPLQDKVI